MARPELGDATVVRIWRTGIDPDRSDDYDAFARTRSVPMFRAQPGFVAVLFTSRGSERAVITLWEDRESADALATSASYLSTVEAIEAAGFLRGEQTVEAFALDGLFTQR
jgi:heme-degrading monooxygenase HmoA